MTKIFVGFEKLTILKNQKGAKKPNRAKSRIERLKLIFEISWMVFLYNGVYYVIYFLLHQTSNTHKALYNPFYGVTNFFSTQTKVTYYCMNKRNNLVTVSSS